MCCGRIETRRVDIREGRGPLQRYHDLCKGNTSSLCGTYWSTKVYTGKCIHMLFISSVSSQNFAGDAPVYIFLHYVFIVPQLVNKQIETWSEKICRGIWRRHVYTSLLPHLKAFNFDDTNKMTLLDVSRFALPDIADPQWALVNTPKTVGVRVH